MAARHFRRRHRTQGHPKLTEWLLAIFDAGTELRVIQRTSALSNLQTKKRLETALDAASGPAPTGLIVRNPDGTPARVSWLDPNGNLMHRPFDGALLANYPAELAIRQCTEVAQRLVAQPSTDARDTSRSRSKIRFAVWRCFLGTRPSASRIASITPV